VCCPALTACCCAATCPSCRPGRWRGSSRPTRLAATLSSRSCWPMPNGKACAALAEKHARPLQDLATGQRKEDAVRKRRRARRHRARARMHLLRAQHMPRVQPGDLQLAKQALAARWRPVVARPDAHAGALGSLDVTHCDCSSALRSPDAFTHSAPLTVNTAGPAALVARVEHGARPWAK
jgi:hypothetical protein